MERISIDWHQKGMKKIEKDYAKSRIQNHECKGLGLVFLNLNRFRYIYNDNLMHKHQEAAQKPQSKNLQF